MSRIFDALTILAVAAAVSCGEAEAPIDCGPVRVVLTCYGPVCGDPHCEDGRDPIDHDPEPELCPAAGPCEEGQDADDHGACDDVDGTWTPCLTVAGETAGDFACSFGDENPPGSILSCAACANRWLDVDFGRTTISCPDLPHTDAVAAD